MTKENAYQSLVNLIERGHGHNIATRSLFHMCWSFAVDSPDYNKKVWQELEKQLIAAKAI